MADSRRTSIRVKLTMVYSLIFAGTSMSLMAGTFLVVRRTLVDEFHRLNNFDLKGDGGSELPTGKVVTIDRTGVPVTIGDLRSKINADQTTALEAMTNHLLITVLTMAAVACVLAVVVGWLLSGRVIRPLRLIVGTAETIAGSNLHRRIRMTGPNDELRHLAETFDAMLERLDRSFDAQRRFIGNASHELRTPLAVSRTLIQVAMSRPESSADLRKLGTKLLTVNAQQATLTDSLLVLARSDQEIRDPRLVDLDAVTRTVLDSSRDHATQARVELVCESAPIQVRGDPVLLTQLVQNLIQNAIDYNYANGQVRVALDSTDGRCHLRISNTGPVIPPDDVAVIFEPFRQLESPRSKTTGGTHGVGLGLSIAEAIITAHHGSIIAEAQLGGGLTMTATLPIAGLGVAGQERHWLSKRTVAARSR